MGQRKLLGHHATRPLIARVGSGPAPDVEPDDQPNAASSPARIPTAPSVTTSHVDLQSSSCRTRLPEHIHLTESLKCQMPLAGASVFRESGAVNGWMHDRVPIPSQKCVSP
jgi:hypothetical protein